MIKRRAGSTVTTDPSRVAKPLAVLGVDAAWTAGRPSGVALLRRAHQGWRYVALAPGYESFIALARGETVDWRAPAQGSAPDVCRLLDAARRMLAGRAVDVVTIDMPVAGARITGRRRCDDAISQAFGRAKCGTHSPTRERPGQYGHALTQAFERAGYSVATARTVVGTAGRLVEVYPHPALLRLLGVERRLPYKVARAMRYTEWNGLDRAARIARLLGNWRAVRAALSRRVEGLTIPLPQATAVKSLATLKRFEDALDAAVCAWVGAMYAEGRAEAYGDDRSAIWIPDAITPRPAAAPASGRT
jgi:predicted RNase H-like nuclease